VSGSWSRDKGARVERASEPGADIGMLLLGSDRALEWALRVWRTYMSCQERPIVENRSCPS
jgi:hypothetical protein